LPSELWHAALRTYESLLMRLALYQPDIPQNTGTILRMAACLGVAVDVIGPTGFDMTDRSLRRAGLDYLDHVRLVRHVDWAAFAKQRQGRLVLATTHGAVAHTAVSYLADDIVLLGRESAGVPEHVHALADLRVKIPIAEGLRSLNIAVAGAVILGEGLRQTGGFPATVSQ
jgi:tRNA (cytidine/uridine-2'-O-)-methyltransferase